MSTLPTDWLVSMRTLVLLVDELQRSGVEVIFLNRELGRSPEDDLLLQVQGMVAEYSLS